ncbi:recombinase family protein [Bacillus sp. NMCN1]|uniref:recombinase family protein n=1 Tax=Bacillus sp. NMCN1 TaxID=2108536 RepID=UPI000D03FD6E|nr:recombinase family protein [Bacillus sp. NMCN1]PRR93690.1 recombinase family protein [Bacillus sp. NMCN1]
MNISGNLKVAVYSRKSREDPDTEDTLLKHREQLKSLLARYNFKNAEWYEEVVSSESIDNRPIFSKLLPRIKSGEFDALCVIAYDRLSRGSQIDSGRIMEACKESNTLIITPQKIYNMSNESDEMLSEFESVIARNEYRAIKRRLLNGRKGAVKAGRPHSGSVPYGYKWDKNDKSAKIVEEKIKIYRMMIDWFLNEEMSSAAIADRLNELQVPPPSSRGKMWYGEVVTYLLTNNFYRGYVWYGKDEESKGLHQPTKTEEEHLQIVERISKLRTYPDSGRRLNMNTNRLSGLIRCPYCLKVQGIDQPKGRQKHVRKCVRKSTTRENMCDTTKGINEDILYRAILQEIKNYSFQVFKRNENQNNDDTTSYTIQLIDLKEKACNKFRGRIERLKELYLDGDLDKNEYKEKLDKAQENLMKSEEELAELYSSVEYQKTKANKKRTKQWQEDNVQSLLESDEGMSEAEINLILKKLISHVSYKIKDNNGQPELDIKVYYN